MGVHPGQIPASEMVEAVCVILGYPTGQYQPACGRYCAAVKAYVGDISWKLASRARSIYPERGCLAVVQNLSLHRSPDLDVHGVPDLPLALATNPVVSIVDATA